MKIRTLLLAACISSPAVAQTPTDSALAADIDAMVRRVMALEPTPGLSIAVVRNDRPVLVSGYGLADVERNRPVTEHTLFYIASTTKAFTGLATTLLAQRGTLDLDAPISRYIPDARWAAGVQPDSITLRHLLSHTHGVANSGPVVLRTAYTGVHDNALLKELLQHHEASKEGRAFRYSNIGYNIAGLIIDEVTRGKWQDLLERAVLEPLRMTSTSAYISRFDSSRLAMPYAAETAGPRRLHFAKTDANMQAAGGLVSSGNDIARWLEVQINSGRLEGQQVFPRAVMQETQRIQAPVTGSSDVVGYSLGWRVSAFGGDTVLHHGGGFSTFGTYISFSPTAKIGVALMVNGANPGFVAVDFLTDYVLQRGGVDMPARTFEEFQTRLEQQRARIHANLAERAARPQQLPLPLQAYTGTFEATPAGIMTWTLRDGRLWAEMGVLKSVAEVFDAARNQLRVELEPGGGEIVQFNFENGRAVSITYSGRTYPRIR